jgi:hypothetical protein
MIGPRMLLATLISSSVVVVPTVGASAARVDPVVQAADATGDVRIFHRADGLSDGQRRTIDASAFTVTPVGDEGDLRFDVTIARVTGSHRFDQMVFVRLVPPAGSEETWETQIGFSPQKPDWAYATRYLDDTGRYRNCEPLVSESTGGTVIGLEVPVKCIPPQEAAIRVELLTGRFRTDANPWSRDRVPVPGTFDLR